MKDMHLMIALDSAIGLKETASITFEFELLNVEAYNVNGII